MNAWIHLVRKELRLGFVPFLIPIVAFIVILLITIYFGNRYGHMWDAVAGVAFSTVSMLIFYLVYYLLISLSAERRRLHLWIHTPMKGYGLLSAKLVAGLISLIITMIITGVIGWIAYSQSEVLGNVLGGFHFEKIVLFFAGNIILLAISAGITIMLFWTIYLVLNNYFRPFISFILTFLLFVLVVTLYGYFVDSAIYDTLTMWGEIKLTGLIENSSFYMDFFDPDEFAEFEEYKNEASIYLGSYIFESIVTIILFFISCWLLDRKVEV